MKKYFIFFILVSAVIFGSRFSNASKPSDFGLKEGDLISAIFSDDPDVYIINEQGYKRLFLNPEIFKFYAHLGGFANIKLVTPEVRDSFPTSGFFRNCEDNDQKVFGTSVEGEDSGRLHWINKSGDQAVQEDPDFFKKVFCINRKEFNWYPRGNEFKALKEVPQYHRTEEAEKPVICHHPIDEPKTFQTIRVAPESLDAHFQHGDTKGACSTSIIHQTFPVDVKINGSDSPISVPYNSVFTVSWTSNGAISCQDFGQFIPGVDSGSWGKYINLPTSGTKSLYARTESQGYLATFDIQVQCTNAAGQTSDDVVHLPVQPPVTPIPSISVTPIPISTITPTPTITVTPAVTTNPTVFPSYSPTPTPTPTLTASPTPTTTAFPSFSPTPTPTPTPILNDSPPVISSLVIISTSQAQPNTIYAGLSTDLYMAVTDDKGITYAGFNAPGMKYSSPDISLYGCSNGSVSCSDHNSLTPDQPGSYTITAKVTDTAGQTTTKTINFNAAGCSTDTECGGSYFPSSGATFCGPWGAALYTQRLKYKVNAVCQTGGSCNQSTDPGVYEDCGVSGKICGFSPTNGGQFQCVTSPGVICASNTAITSSCLCGPSSYEQYGYCCRDSSGNLYQTTSTCPTAALFSPNNTKNFAAFSRNLTLGSIGNDVKQLQALLVNEVGYSADLITGYFGRITRDAVKRLQEKYDIKPTSGYFGILTRKTLNALILNR